MNGTKKSRPEASLGVFAVIAMAVCCAGPVLLAGGALGAIGGLFSKPLVIGIGVAVVAAALAGAFWRAGRRDDSCCDLEPPSRGRSTTSGRMGQ